jgi:crotonobetainyl-CoA:carnitine CoA-transferase CaiB-like acyl-CoA transferase
LLAGIRVLDLTRVLAGPVATRLLAGWGAEVLRIDPPDWDEPAVAAEVTLGKRCARLDLRSDGGRAHFLELLGSADVMVHGYRADSLERLGLGPGTLEARRPGLVEVSLNAYGWSGPWRNRRGFDSLVQMSAGVARAGQEAAGAERPTPLPVQALDHATGYLLAASAIQGLNVRLQSGIGSRWRTSLARMAALLVAAGPGEGEDTDPITALRPPPADSLEHTTWGPARRLAPPLRVVGAPLHWHLAARALGSDRPMWGPQG